MVNIKVITVYQVAILRTVCCTNLFDRNRMSKFQYVFFIQSVAVLFHEWYELIIVVELYDSMNRLY